MITTKVYTHGEGGCLLTKWVFLFGDALLSDCKVFRIPIKKILKREILVFIYSKGPKALFSNVRTLTTLERNFDSFLGSWQQRDMWRNILMKI